MTRSQRDSAELGRDSGETRESLDHPTTYFEPPEPPRRLITTFYSFKGGVGRSMALQGVAMQLAGRRQRVLMVDADIEAPGLSLAYEAQLPPQREGFVDIAGDVAQRTLEVIEGRVPATPGLFDDLPARLTSLSHVIRRSEPADSELEPRLQQAAQAIGGEVPPLGVAALLPVGTVLQDYSSAVRRLALDRLFDLEGPDAPAGLVQAAGLPEGSPRAAKAADVFTAAIRRALLRAALPDGTGHFDHVFIDSRTGLPDVAGMCVRWLPDRLVLVTGLNEQNIRGTRYMLDYAEVDPNDSDRVTIVVGPVPPAELGLLDLQLQRVKDVLRLDRDPALLHYEPWVALSDLPLPEDLQRHTRLHRDYRGLSLLVEHLAGFHGWRSGSQILRALASPRGDYRRAAQGLLALAAVDPPQAAELAGDVSIVTEDAGRRGSEQEPILRVVTAVSPDDWRAHGMLADALADQAETAEAERALSLFQEAEGEYERTAQLQPTSDVVWYNWGNALGDWAQAVLPSDRDRALGLYEEAGAKYARAVEIKPDKHEAWSNWGATLGGWAEALLASDPDGALSLYEQAGARCAQAVEIKPDMREAWCNWGTALGHWAQAVAPTDLPRALALYQEASAKYARAIQIKPDDHEPWCSWGSALLSRWHLTPEDAILDEAAEKLAKAEQLDAKATNYNLACLAALRGKPDEAFERLETELRAERTSWSDVSKDPDWDHLRDDERYKRLQQTFGS